MCFKAIGCGKSTGKILKITDADIDAFCATASKFSAMIDALRDTLAEVDVNPVIVHETGCTIVDALVVS